MAFVILVKASFILGVEDLMDIDIRGSDFSPFATKTEALLFMLVNSHQPIVSHCHLVQSFS